MQAALFEFDLSEHRSLLQRASEVAKPLLRCTRRWATCTASPRSCGATSASSASPAPRTATSSPASSPRPTRPPELRLLLATVNDLFNARYNGILVNYYTNGEDYISDHRDDELGLDPSVGVLTISYGAERTFRVKPWNHEKRAPYPAKESLWLSVPARSCHALLMAGQDFQKELAHGVLPQPGAGGRISFTLRFARH